MKKLPVTIALFILAITLFAQPRGGGSMVWLPDGNSYLCIDKLTVVKTEMPSLTKTTLYNLEKLIPAKGSQERTITSFTVSDDQQRLLLNVDTKTVFHKTTGECWVYNCKKRQYSATR